MKLKVTFFAFLFIFQIGLSNAQEPTRFTGKIIDFETKKPIPLVTIQSPSVYTITNTDGEFEAIPQQTNEQITLSHISYHSLQIDFKNMPEVIELQPKTFELAELIVTPRETLVKELKEVWNKYMALTKDKKDKDFPESTFYYRQLTANDGLYTEYIEAFFTSPTTVAVLSLSLQEGRFARIKKDSVAHFTNYFYLSMIIPFSRKKDKNKKVIKTFLYPDFDKHYEIYLNRVISPAQEDEVKVYEFVPHQHKEENALFLSGKLFIRTKDRAIIRAEIKPVSMGVTFDHKTKVISEEHTFILSYREGIVSYPIIESVQADSKIKAIRNQKETTIHLSSILFANEFTFDKKGKKIKQKDHLLQEIAKSKYNQAFWDDNSVVKRTKIEQQVLDDFNREGYFGTMNMVQ